MRLLLSTMLAVILGAGSVHAAADEKANRSTQVGNAVDYLRNHQLPEAIAASDIAIASFEAEYSKPDRLVFCADDQVQTLAVLLTAVNQNKEAITISSEWCTALFVKGFALVDLQRPAEAEPFLKRAAEMAPLNSHYLNEYAEWHKANRNWQQAYDLYAKARSVIEFAPTEFKKEHEARSLRGMGYTMIEMGKLDDAEKLFNQSLKLLPGHQGALSELQYIADLRKQQR